MTMTTDEQKDLEWTEEQTQLADFCEEEDDE